MDGEEEFYVYFIFRSMIMGVLGAVLFALLVWALGITDLLQLVLASTVNFFLALFISRLFDRQIKYLVNRLLRLMNTHPKVKGFILNNF